MSQNPRAFRMADQIQLEISDILRNKIRDPRKGFITITAVEVTNDLKTAKIFVSALGDKADLLAALDLLNHAKGFIRTELGSRISARFVPELVFRADESAARGVRIEKLLDDLKEGRLPDDDEGADE
jgi:ribosome-binding factor A